MDSPLLRFLDIIFSVMGMIVAAPIMLLVLIFGHLESGSPIFVQQRLGRHQIPFNIIKFRTMALKTPSVATHLADPTLIMPFGKFLRTTKLDELPQLWNVFRGEMSFVGPRPGLVQQVELTYEREKRGVFLVRPGITGLSQVSGIDMSKPKLLAQTDAKMIAEMSTSSYFKYIFLTVSGVGYIDRTNHDK